ncbi:MAG: hypothetical protein JNK63_06915 [Chthonomonas sp.]|nr:hypothetical protein [Chthonomonas sp.]
MSEEIHVVTVMTGDKYGDEYLNRLYNMVERNLDQPFRFTVFTDRSRPVSPKIHQVDCSAWGLSGWFNKLRLFDREILPEPFLFFDVTLVIMRPLKPLLDNIRELGKDICSRRDFRHDEINSCIMAVRPSELTQSIWEAYQKFEHPEDADHGDQSFTYHTLRRQGKLDELGYLDPALILSYRHLRRLAHEDPRAAQEQLKNAVVLKFHGTPKMSDVLSPLRALRYSYLKAPLRPLSFAGYLRKEIAEWWR